jgi:ribonuclease P protein subunit POP4
MKVTSDIICSEFIGTESKISESFHQGYVGIVGEVINETKNTFTIIHRGRAKKIVKDQAVFRFKFSNGSIVEVEGRLLTGRSEDRLKKSTKRLW